MLYIFNHPEKKLLIVAKGETAFMACSYANDLLQKKGVFFEFSTYDAIELDNDLAFGVTYSNLEGS